MTYNKELETTLKYFKNTELAKLYNISEKSVRNWIQSSLDGKLDLQLYEANGKSFVANTTKNTATIDDLVLKGKKFRNRKAHKIVTPSPQFYKIYSEHQIFDIISNIDIHREVPYEYSYFSRGATLWDEYTRRLLTEKTSNPITNTIKLLSLSQDYIESLVAGYTHVNIVDIGVGNCLPVRDLIQHFIDQGTLKRYIGIDISKDMLKIAENNLKNWFKGDVRFEGYVRDINYDRFNDLLVEDSFKDDDSSTLNIILFFGGTISNLREPNHALSTIHESMGKDDILLFSKRPDTSNSRRYFDFIDNKKAAIEFQNFRGKTIVDLLGLDESHYDVEQYFDNEKMTRLMRLRLKVALSIEFEFNQKRRTVELNKDDTLLLWRATHQSTIEIIQQFQENDFELLQLTKTRDKEYLMLISKLLVNERD